MGTSLQAPNHYEGAETLRSRRKVPTMSQLTFSIQYICFRKTLGSNLCLAQDAI